MKRIILTNHAMGVIEGQRQSTPEEDAANSGNPHTVKTWTQVFVDRDNGDRIELTFERAVRDDLVRQLTGGVVLAGGEFPKI